MRGRSESRWSPSLSTMLLFKSKRSPRRAVGEGTTALQTARFVGVDGPRWFLRGLFLGSAASAGGHDRLTGVFKDIAVVRGTEAMPSGEPLELRMPVQGQDSAVQAQGVSSVAEDGEL